MGSLRKLSEGGRPIFVHPPGDIGSKQVSQTVVHNGDQPPSYEDTMKTGPVSGGFVDPGLPVKTIVQVVQVPMPELGPSPARLQCPSCQMEITTSTSSKVTLGRYHGSC